MVWLVHLCRLEDFEVDEEDEEALIEQRRLQRLAIVQVCGTVRPYVTYQTVCTYHDDLS